MRVGVVGAGSWGTALAALLARNGHEVALWAYEPDVAAAINNEHVNRVFLPDAPLDHAITASPDLTAVVGDAELLVSASPSHVVRSVSSQVNQALGRATPLVVSVSKGLEQDSHATMSQVLGETLPRCRVVALSGPSFAREVYQQQPTAVVAASNDLPAAETAQQILSNGYFRVYTSSDVIGVELGGALKNVVAIAAGILEGLGLGHNPRAALMTRGLAEMSRLGTAMGADPLTFAGLAGLGDLVLTATGPLSRNRSLGVELGRGRTLEEALRDRRTVAEGVRTARTAVQLAEREEVELPIAREVSHILFDGKPPRQAIEHLMERALKAEQWK